MANLVLDGSGKPAPQYLKSDGTAYEYQQGQNGAMFVAIRENTAKGVVVLSDVDANAVSLKINGQIITGHKEETVAVGGSPITLAHAIYKNLIVHVPANVTKLTMKFKGTVVYDIAITAPTVLAFGAGTDHPILPMTFVFEVTNTDPAQLLTLNWML